MNFKDISICVSLLLSLTVVQYSLAAQNSDTNLKQVKSSDLTNQNNNAVTISPTTTDGNVDQDANEDQTNNPTQDPNYDQTAQNTTAGTVATTNDSQNNQSNQQNTNNSKYSLSPLIKTNHTFYPSIHALLSAIYDEAGRRVK